MTGRTKMYLSRRMYMRTVRISSKCGTISEQFGDMNELDAISQDIRREMGHR